MNSIQNGQLGDLTDSTPPLSGRELERLVHVIESSLEVRRRSQFFLWAQGQLQSMIPHEVMIAAWGDLQRRSVSVEHFSSYPLPGQDVESLIDTDGGLVIQLGRYWMERGERPLLVCGHERQSAAYRHFESALFRHAFPNLAAHGTPVLAGTSTTFFAFANLPQPLGARLGYMLELLVPYIHCAYLRMLVNERPDAAEGTALDRVITAREVEILQWVRDGKSNLEIGGILGISPLTVKNHVQKILKKLGVQNRAQAVARGIAAQIIKPGNL